MARFVLQTVKRHDRRLSLTCLGPRDGGRTRTRTVLVGGLVVVALVVVAVLASTKINDMLPRQLPDAANSRVSAKLLNLVPRAVDCRTQAVYDVSGSSALTKYQIGTLTVDGFGATIQSGQVVRSGCFNSAGVRLHDEVEQDRDVKYIDLKVTEWVYDTNLTDSAVIVDTNPDLTDFAKGVLATVRSAGSTGCKLAGQIPSSPFTANDCKGLLAFTSWDVQQQALLRSALTKQTNQYVQVDCARTSIRLEKQAIVQSYKDLAISQNINPDDVKVRFVDQDGNETEDAPDFTKSVKDNLYKDGVVEREAMGSPALSFTNTACSASPLLNVNKDGAEPKK
jgi:hypothetical protein